VVSGTRLRAALIVRHMLESRLPDTSYPLSLVVNIPRMQHALPSHVYIGLCLQQCHLGRRSVDVGVSNAESEGLDDEFAEIIVPRRGQFLFAP
jgi:hypothetical protein